MNKKDGESKGNEYGEWVRRGEVRLPRIAPYMQARLRVMRHGNWSFVFTYFRNFHSTFAFPFHIAARHGGPHGAGRMYAARGCAPTYRAWQRHAGF